VSLDPKIVLARPWRQQAVDQRRAVPNAAAAVQLRGGGAAS